MTEMLNKNYEFSCGWFVSLGDVIALSLLSWFVTYLKLDKYLGLKENAKPSFSNHLSGQFVLPFLINFLSVMAPVSMPINSRETKNGRPIFFCLYLCLPLSFSQCNAKFLFVIAYSLLRSFCSLSFFLITFLLDTLTLLKEGEFDISGKSLNQPSC